MKLASIKHKKEIDNIFTDKGFGIYDSNIKLRATISNADTKFLISVPTRLFKKAVDRNRIKRLIRVAIQKSTAEFKCNYNIALLYHNESVLTLTEIETSINSLFTKLVSK